MNFNKYPSDSCGNVHLRNTTEFPEQREPCIYTTHERSPNRESWKMHSAGHHLNPVNIVPSAPCLQRGYFELNSSSMPSIDILVLKWQRSISYTKLQYLLSCQKNNNNKSKNGAGEEMALFAKCWQITRTWVQSTETTLKKKITRHGGVHLYPQLGKVEIS